MNLVDDRGDFIDVSLVTDGGDLMFRKGFKVMDEKTSESPLSYAIDTAVNDICRKKNGVLKKALEHFNISMNEDSIKDAVNLRLTEDHDEHLLINGVLAITFYKIEVSLDGTISMKYKEHYSEECK